MHQVAGIGQPVPGVARRLHVLKDREVVEELERLERAHQPGTGPVLGAPRADVVLAQEDPTPARTDEAGDGVNGRRLARPVRPDEAEHLFAPDFEAEAGERFRPTEGDRNVAEGED